MASCLILLTFFFSNLSPGGLPSSADLPGSKIRATWLWDTSLITTPEDRNSVLQFAKKMKLGRIYLQINRSIEPDCYRIFIHAASSSGIQVHALDGAPDWIKPNKRQRIAETVQWVKAFNAAASEAEERFTGIQLDIEPYSLAEWNYSRKTTVAQWLDALTEFAAEAKKETGLTASAALPFWLNELDVAGGSRSKTADLHGSSSDGNGSLIEAMLAPLDEVTLMTYRNQAHALAEISSANLSLGDRLGKKIFVAVETNKTSEPAYITFYSKGKMQLEQELASIDQLLGHHPSYAGIAIHDYSGWRSLHD
jgi:hypothetical protein